MPPGTLHALLGWFCKPCCAHGPGSTQLCRKERMSWAVRAGLQKCLHFIEKWYVVLTTWYFNCLMLIYSRSIGLLGLSRDSGCVILLPWHEGNLRGKKITIRQECWIWVSSDAWPPCNIRFLRPSSLLPP